LSTTQREKQITLIVIIIVSSRAANRRRVIIIVLTGEQNEKVHCPVEQCRVAPPPSLGVYTAWPHHRPKRQVIENFTLQAEYAEPLQR
jgi:hypothetical protein